MALTREPLQGIWPFSVYDECFKFYRASSGMRPRVLTRIWKYRVFKLMSRLSGQRTRIDEDMCGRLLGRGRNG